MVGSLLLHRESVKNTDLLRASLPAIGVLIASLLLPAAGHAAEVGVVVTQTPCPLSGCVGSSPSSEIVFRAAPKEANRVGYAFEPGGVVFTERSGAPLTAGPGCQERQPGTVVCAASGSTAIKVETGNGADVVRPQPGGAQLAVSLDGGTGDDVLVGGSANDVLDGGGGGRDELHGGAGRDKLDDGDRQRHDADTLDGGPGSGDEVSYAKRTDDLDVDLARSAGPDGDVLARLESVKGGSGDDRLVASLRRGGILSGGKGADMLRGRARGDILLGDEGRDVIVGGKGDDGINGGLGRDVVSGGPGSDDINTDDGTRELVHCGTGRDLVGGSEGEDFTGDSVEVGPDAGDLLARDCEAVRTESETRPIPAHPLRVSRKGLRLRNACRPCSTPIVTVRIGSRLVARGRLARRPTAMLKWRRPPRRGRTVDARIAWNFRGRAMDYAFTVQLRIP